MKKQLPILIAVVLIMAGCAGKSGNESGLEVAGDTIVIKDIFPYQKLHCHGSTVVELPGGDLLAAWFHGSGERTSDDVKIMGSRFSRKYDQWSEPFLMADVEEFPDINPVLFIDTKSRLWLVWYTVMAYQWESSLITYRISTDYMNEGPPVWSWQEVLYMKPDGPSSEGIGKNDPFVLTLKKKYDEYFGTLTVTDKQNMGPVGISQEMFDRAMERYMDIAMGTSFMRDGIDINDNGERIRTRVGYPLMRRIGWQTRNKPLITGKRILLPLYSDGFDFSLIAITENDGETWSFSEPIVGAGCIQPALAMCSDSSIVAYMRDNGPAPHRLMLSRSGDMGKTWSLVGDTEIPNPGSGADMVKLRSGSWIIVSNDLDEGRHRLSVWLSDDEGKSWKYRKSIVDGEPRSQTRAHYPAVIQDSEGLIHVTYTNQVPAEEGKSNVKNIAHAVFTESWLKR